MTSRTTRRQLLLLSSVFAAGCATSPTSATPTTRPDEYADAITRHLDRLAREQRPVENSAIPPRHLDTTTFPTALVDRDRIVSGGPPPDGIPSIDEPQIVLATDVDWIEDVEPVMVVDIDGAVRAYPVQIMTWHEIVNDTLAGVEIAVTYCPLCNSGVAYERTLGDRTLDFGTSGALFQANLVMYDRQTESLWTQFDGRAVLGTDVGEQLVALPLTTISWGEYVAAFPDGEVLSRNTGHTKPYGRNPYNAYDEREAPVAGFYTGEVDGTLAPYERVVGLDLGNEQLALRLRDVRDDGVIAIELAGLPLTVWHRAGTASALNTPEIADGDDIGATGVFIASVDGAVVEFERRDDVIVDVATQSTWNLLGRATSGPLEGTQLEAVVHADTFWFAWATFQVEPALYDPS